MMRRGLIPLTLLLLASCSLAPDYHRPETPAATAYKEAAPVTDTNGNVWSPANPAAADRSRGAWWQVFNDPTLNELETKLTDANQNLKAAVARYDEARAGVGIAHADYFPTITGNANTSRAQTSKTVGDTRPVSLYNDTLVGADVSYELDVWGRVRNSVNSAENRAQASAADLAAVNLSLEANLAMDYFALRGDDTAQQILDNTVAAYQKALQLTENRHNGGAATAADVDQAQTQLQNAKTMAEDMRLKRAQLEHAVAVLTGALPMNFTLPPAAMADQEAQGKMMVIDPGLPSALLERRPDIAEAERLVAAANADIGVARAAYFPTFTLDGAAGFESEMFNHLLKSSSLFWSLGPGATVPLFDGGRIASMSAQARAAYQETAANYRQTVLSAYQEVEDNLVAIRQLDKEHESQTAATAAAKNALQQAQNRYKGGIVTYLDVVVEENTALQAELASVDVRTRELNAHVLLIKSLGGGWQAAKP